MSEKSDAAILKKEAAAESVAVKKDEAAAVKREEIAAVSSGPLIRTGSHKYKGGAFYQDGVLKYQRGDVVNPTAAELKEFPNRFEANRS